jgi:hypothetical protein
MQTEQTQRSRTTLNLLIDGAIFVAFLIATAPRLSGIAIHEWLGIAFGAAVVAHLLLHWRWIVGVTTQLFRTAMAWARLNYALNALLFVAVTVIVFTGVMISESVLPLFGVRFAHDGSWRTLHRLASDAAVFLIGLHVALHWRWVVGAVRRLVRPRRRAALQPQVIVSGVAQEAQR